jgi:hypothetical protein
MWGPKEFKTIELNGKPLTVRENLWQALSSLRLETEPRILWIDAVCINQEDIGERNHQVMQMGIIYSQASRVVVWLGLADDSAQLAFQACNRLYDDVCSFGVDSSLNFLGGELEAIDSLCSREYWTRLWIVQEVLLGKNILLCCGDLQLGWRSFEFVVINAKAIYKTTISIQEANYVERINRSTSKRICWSWENRNTDRSYYEVPEDLGALCANYGRSKIEERKDRVFGLYGIVGDCCKNAVTINYSAPWLEICNRVFDHYILVHLVGLHEIWEDRKGLHEGAMVEKSQKFHMALKLGSQDYIHHAEPALFVSDYRPVPNSMPIEVSGIIRGAISHVLPLSNAAHELKKISLGSFSRSFSTYLLEQVERINNLKPNRRDMTHSGWLTHDLDLVSTFPPPLCEASWDRDSDHHLLIRESNPSGYGYSGFSLTLDHIWRLIGIDGIDRTSAFAGTCSLAFQEDGTICFFPNDARTGDLLAFFRDSNVVALVRRKGEGEGELIGRCVDFLPSRAGELLGLSLQLDLRTLHLLTCASARGCLDVD